MKKVFIFVLASFSFALVASQFHVISIVPIILVVHTARAQTIGTASLDGVDIAATPANPAPGDAVTVTVTSYNTDLNGASINWIVAGKSFTRGTGVTSVTVQAPPLGKSVQILANIETVEGADIQKVVTVQSSSVDMIVETSGYVPPLYRGKNPIVYQNALRIIAVPHLIDATGAAIPPQDLIYTWKQDSTVLGDQNGFGKQTLVVQQSIIPRPFAIYVDVSSKDGSVHGEGQLGITATSPEIGFYQDDPLYGVLYNEAVVDSVDLIHDQLKIVATPYGFDLPDTGGAPIYDWMVNDTDHPELASSTSIILATPAGTSGTSDVSLNIQNTADILQDATAGFSAVFDNTTAGAGGTGSVGESSNGSASF